MTDSEDFKLKPFLDAAEELLRSDETARALWLLDNLPAYYREYVPEEIKKLKAEIMSMIATPSFYATHHGDEITLPGDTYLKAEGTLRATIVHREVKSLNHAGFTPNIYDLGPGEYWTPRLLKHQGLRFNYQPIYVNHATHNHYYKYIEDIPKPQDGQPNIFFACEIIEHLWQESDIRFEMQRHIGQADIVHISTPLYTFDTGCIDFRDKKDLGHLRAYTPREFQQTVYKIFNDYSFIFYESQIQHARGVNPFSGFDCVRESQSINLMADYMEK